MHYCCLRCNKSYFTFKRKEISIEFCPLVSILITLYNGSNYVEQAIHCAINQTYKNIRIIISDDCSKDETSKILKQYEEKDERVIVEMAEYISDLDIDEDICKKKTDDCYMDIFMVNGCRECIIDHFRKKCE